MIWWRILIANEAVANLILEEKYEDTQYKRRSAYAGYGRDDWRM